MGKAWVKARKHDEFYRHAKEEGYRTRAAYKLIQTDARFNLIYEGDTVVDLGAAPGGWSQVARYLVGDGGRVVATDRVGMRPIEGVEFLRADLEDPEALAALVAHVGEADAVISDMAPRLSGNRTLDHARSVGLARLALSVARQVLRPGGNFLCKVFRGEEYEDFLREASRAFESCRGYNPEASRKESREIYVVGREFGRPTRPARGPSRGTPAPRRAGPGGRAPRRGSATRRRTSGGA